MLTRLYLDFSDAQGQPSPKPVAEFRRNSNSSKLLQLSLLPARMTCETFQLLNGKGINAEFPSNKPNRIKKLFPSCSSRKNRVDHRYTCDFVFIIKLYWSFIDLPVASSRISRVLARCKVIMRLFYLTEQVGMLNLKSERKKYFFL